jgi:hypothetical protein
VFVGLAAMPALAMLGVHVIDARWLHVSSLVHPHWRTGDIIWAFILSIGFLHVRSLVEIPFIPALVNLASKTHRGEHNSVLGSLRVFVARWRSYIWIGILMLAAELVIPEIVAAIAMCVTAAICSAIGYFGSHPYSPILVILLMLVPIAIFLALFLWLGACFSLAFPAAVFEQTVGFKAMWRSWRLSKNSRGRIVAVWVMILVLNWVVMIGFRSLYRSAMTSAHAWHHLGSAWRITYSAGIYTLDSIVIALFGSLLPIAITLIYYDQRIRHEGYDIEEMMDVAGLSEVGTMAGSAAQSQESGA